MDAPHLPRQALIDAHSGGGFRFGGLSHRRSLLCLPDGIWARGLSTSLRHCRRMRSPTCSRRSANWIFLSSEPARFLGSCRTRCGRLRTAQISPDTMAKAAAVRTYNVMLTENRRVGAGLIAVA